MHTLILQVEVTYEDTERASRGEDSTSMYPVGFLRFVSALVADRHSGLAPAAENFRLLRAVAEKIATTPVLLAVWGSAVASGAVWTRVETFQDYRTRSVSVALTLELRVASQTTREDNEARATRSSEPVPASTPPSLGLRRLLRRQL